MSLTGTRTPALCSDRLWALPSSCPLPTGGKEAGASRRQFTSVCSDVKNVAALHFFILLCLTKYVRRLLEISVLSLRNVSTHFLVASSLLIRNILLSTPSSTPSIYPLTSVIKCHTNKKRVKYSSVLIF